MVCLGDLKINDLVYYLYKYSKRDNNSKILTPYCKRFRVVDIDEKAISLRAEGDDIDINISYLFEVIKRTSYFIINDPSIAIIPSPLLNILYNVVDFINNEDF